MSNPLRVAHLTPAYFSPESVIGGGERYVYYVAQSLRMAGGIEQCVFATGAEDKLFEHDGLAVRVLRNESSSSDAMEGFTAALWQELPGFDLVHMHQCMTIFGAYSTAIVRSLNIPIVGTDLGAGEHPLMLSRRGIELLDGIVSISRFAHGLIAGLFSGPHEVMVGPVDTCRFTPAMDIARNRHTVLCVSRIMPHKGIDRVIAALPSRLRLIVIGRVYHDTYYEALRAMAKGRDVEFVHDADDDALRHHYRTAGLFVQASTARDMYGNAVAKPELMGLTTLEALSCGLPVAVSNTGSLPELISDPRFGRVFSGDEELSSILEDVADGTWPREGAGAHARAHVAAVHSMAAIGQRMASFYRDILATRRRCAFSY